VLNDIWFASAENMMFIKHTVKKDFVMRLKANRKVALSADDKQQGRYVAVETLVLEPHTVQEIYLEGVISRCWPNKSSQTTMAALV
jgi:hypothetical protein